MLSLIPKSLLSAPFLCICPVPFNTRQGKGESLNPTNFGLEDLASSDILLRTPHCKLGTTSDSHIPDWGICRGRLTNSNGHSFSYGGVNCLKSDPKRVLYVCMDHRHWFHWTAVWLQLHVSLVHAHSLCHKPVIWRY